MFLFDAKGKKNNPSYVKFSQNGQLAPFGRLKVANPKTLFDSKQIHDEQHLLWSTKTNGTGLVTYDNSTSSSLLSVVTTGDYAIRQTKQRFNYQPGKGQVILFSGVFNAGTNCISKQGYFDGNNGIYLSVEDGVCYWNILNNGVVTERVSSSDWNYDKLDGNGKSRAKLNINSTNIGIIQFEWLGVGRVGVGFDIGGETLACHVFDHASTSFVDVYTQTPNLPVRYEIISSGGACELKSICCSVQSEGMADDISVSRSLFNFEKTIAITGIALVPICVFRLKSTHKGATINPISVNPMSTTNDNFGWCVLLNPTYGGSITYHSSINSAIEYQNLDTAVPLTLSNAISDSGIILDSGYVSTSNRSIDVDINNALRLGFDLDDVADNICLAIQTFNNATVTGSITYRELL